MNRTPMLLLLFASGCGADGFFMIGPPLDGAAEAPEPSEAAVDGSVDAPSSEDARTEGNDVLADGAADSAPCTTITPYTWTCQPVSAPWYSEPITPPNEYCSDVSNPHWPTPAACKCKETYNCACLASQGKIPQGCKCSDGSGHLFVQCS